MDLSIGVPILVLILAGEALVEFAFVPNSWNVLEPHKKRWSSEAGHFSQMCYVCLEFGHSNQLITQVNHVTVP